MKSRREVLKLALAGAAATTTAGAATAEPILGLVMPVDPLVPPEAAAMYPTGVRFQANSVALKKMTPQGYDEVSKHRAGRKGIEPAGCPGDRPDGYVTELLQRGGLQS